MDEKKLNRNQVTGTGILFLTGGLVYFFLFGLPSIKFASDMRELFGNEYGGDLFVQTIFLDAVLPWGFAIMGLFALLSGLTMPDGGSHNETKKCPYCAEIIKAEARVCRYCKGDVSGVAPSLKPSKGLRMEEKLDELKNQWWK